MPVQYKAGTPVPRYYDPKGRDGAADAKGVYTDSVFYAPLCVIDVDGELFPDTGLQDDTVQLLLFTTDLPLICRAYVRDNDTQLTNTQNCSNRLTLGAGFVADAAGGGSAVTVVNYGEVLKGYSGVGQLVPVSGFASQTGPITPPFSNLVALLSGVIAPGSANSVAIQCIANGGSLMGVIGVVFYGNKEYADANAPNPIILKSSEYTAAMRENKNLYTDSAGLKFQIVGLYYVVTPT